MHGFQRGNRTMKNSFRMAAAALCMALGVASIQAQVTNTLSLKLQTLNVSLTGCVGSGGTNAGAATNFRVTTKDIIKATGVSSNTAAKLQFASAEVASTDTTNTALLFFVTTGNSKNPVFTDVTPLFLVDTNSDLFVKGNTGNQIMTFGFGLDTNSVPLTNILGGPLTPITFKVQGFTTFQKSGSFNSAVNGTGTSGDSPTVLKGTISATPPNNKPQTVIIVR